MLFFKGNYKKVTKLRDSTLYGEDWIELKTLDENGKPFFEEVNTFNTMFLGNGRSQ